MHKPKVSIVMATYRPCSQFLSKQLQSIDNQTYPNIELLICDDSADSDEHKKILHIVQRCMKNVPYKIIKNKVNLGSNKTFERLTMESSGDYISYCDQDDIWETQKIEKLVDRVKFSNGVLVYSDLSIIDSMDRLIKSSFKQMNFRLKHIEGGNCFFRLIRRNSVTGCTMLIRLDIAKKACPFPKGIIYPHDHWLAIYSAAKGNIQYVTDPLVKYRIHSSNQIGNKRFIDIKNIQDYYLNRISLQLERYNFIEKRIKLGKKNILELNNERNMVLSRKKFFYKKNIYNLKEILKFSRNDFILVLFEIFLFSIPVRLSTKILNKFK